MEPSMIAIVVFLITYGFIITEKVNRAVISLLGASVLVILGVLDIHKVFTHYIEWNTLALLAGMMILVGVTNQSGVFQFVAIRLVKMTKGYPVSILIVLSLLTAVLSALLDNVTTMLLLVPITFSITKILHVDPVPYLISEVIVSNIGGTATLIGDPPNIMIGSANPHLTFNSFLIHLAPIALVILAVTLVLLYLIYRNKLVVSDEDRQQLMQLNEKEYITDVTLMQKSLLILTLTMIGFLLHSFIHMSTSVIAILGATLLLLIAYRREKDVEEAFDSIEWVTIFFFVGLFALVGGLQQTGVLKNLALQMIEITDGNIAYTATLILWVSGIASGFIDNIPFVATMIPLIKDIASTLGFAVSSPEINVLWWSLALGACLGGNATIIGASANVIVAGMAAREGNRITYFEFLKIGFPITLISLAIAHLYLYIRYFVDLS